MAAEIKTTLLDNRIDAELKRQFDSTAEQFGLNLTREQFTKEMGRRYDRMLAGRESEHDLIEE